MSGVYDPRTVGLLVAMLIAAVAGVIVLLRWSATEKISGQDATLRRIIRSWIVLVASTWFLLTFGASVRVNGAGLACPDWPACFGRVIPALNWPVFLEFGHRTLAGIIGLAFLGLSGLILANVSLRRPFLPWLIGAAVALAIQIVLGGLTVLHLLAEWTVASHLLGGNIFCLMLAIIGWKLNDRATTPKRAAISWGSRLSIGIMALGVVIQMVLGGFVSSSHAGLACATWPTCDGVQWFPTWSGLIGLQLTHRLVAYGLLVLSIVHVVVFWQRGRLGTAARAVLAAVLVQASIGIVNVLLHLPVEVTLLHTAGAATLFLTTGWLNYEAWAASGVARQRVASPSVTEVGNLRAEAR